SWDGNLGIPCSIPYQKGDYANNGLFWGSGRYCLAGDSVTVFDVIEMKKSDFKNALDTIQHVPKTDTAWFMTSTSANVFGAAQIAFDIAFPNVGINPKNVAEGITYQATPVTVEHYPGVNEFLDKQTFDGRVGTVVMDFVHDSVIKEVIGANNAAPTDIA